MPLLIFLVVLQYDLWNNTQKKEVVVMKGYINETVRSIMERRSIREYKPQQITNAELDIIINCGLYAPSARNTQNWHFTVIQDPQTIESINNKIKSNMTPDLKEFYKERQGGNDNFSMFYGAPTIVLVSGKAGDDYTDSNCAYATQNMCVAAYSLGIASIIVGMARLMFETDAEATAKKFGIPDRYKFLYAVCFGYSDIQPKAPDRLSGRVDYIR